MGVIHVVLFSTLDLVGQAPGSSDEDPEGFPYGGWQDRFSDEVAGSQIRDAYATTDALLLGRRTYDIFAGYWPHQHEGFFATLFNAIPKYVASRGRPALTWEGSELLGLDLPSEVAHLRERHRDVTVVGSLDLVQTLLRERLVDTVDLWLHPVVLGVGKRVFERGTVPTTLRLLTPPAAGPSGTVNLRYAVVPDTVPDGARASSG